MISIKSLYTKYPSAICLLLCCLVSSLVLLLRLWFVFWQIQRRRRTFRFSDNDSTLMKSKKPLKTMIVLGSGGHTTEILRMSKSLNPKFYHPVCYVKASTDSTSAMRLQAILQQRSNGQGKDCSSVTTIHDIPRAREVGQSYWTSIATTIRATWVAFSLVATERPDVILCNGPGTCLPIVATAFLLFRILPLWLLGSSRVPTTTIFIESYCRVETLSLTGKLLYYVADMFIVHWEELHQKYPSTSLCSAFVNHKIKKKS